MKLSSPLLFSIGLLTAGIILILCTSFSPAESYYYGYKPYYMKRADLNNSVVYQDTAHDMVDPGKIYVRGNQLFINEKYQGIHIVDNSNPEMPTRVAFIFAPGCIDMAVKGDIIYLDNAVDLVAFDIASKQVTERIENAFPPPISPYGDRCHYEKGDTYIPVGWKKINR